MMLALAALAPPSYQIVDLGAPPGAEGVEAVAINGRGELLVRVQETVVVPWTSNQGEKGESQIPVRRGYLWRKGAFLSLGEAERTSTFDPPSIEPLAFNDLSVAVGWKGTGMPLFMSGLSENKAILCRGRGAEDLGTGPTSEALGINDLGDVVGDGGHRAFARLRGRIVWLAPVSRITPSDPAGEMNDANHCAAVAINDRRQILMNSTYGKDAATSHQRPFIVNGNAPSTRPRAVELPHGYRDAIGVRLGGDGTVLGVAYPGGIPFLSKGSQITVLPSSGRAPVEVSDMNGRGDVVGRAAWRVDPQDSSPLLWRQGKPAPLPTFPGWTLQTATGINDQGQICGIGLHDGRTRAFLLNPPREPGVSRG